MYKPKHDHRESVANDLAWEELAQPLERQSAEFRQIAHSIIRAGRLSIPHSGGTKWEPPAAKPFIPAGYHRLFCTHHVPYWRVCGRCGRSKEAAAEHARLSGPLVAALAAALQRRK